MAEPKTRRHVARITIELTSPMSIGTGQSEAFEDFGLVLDANGLPAVPATSLAGVLRHAYEARHGEDSSEALFGCTETAGAQGDKGGRSRISLSWGHLHDSGDRPVPGELREPAHTQNDQVLDFARAKVVRDHVRLNHGGVVDNRGKFDRSSVAAGHRFTFELVWEGATGERSLVPELLGLLDSPAVRLGAATRSGLGAFRVVQALARDFDLTDKSAFAAYAGLSTSLRLSAAEVKAAELAPLAWQALEGLTRRALTLHAEEPFVVGGGDPDEWTPPRQHGERDTGDKASPPDLLPYQESRVVWSSDGEGTVVTRYVAPATALKGALRHRVAYHARALSGLGWVDSPTLTGRNTHDLSAFDPAESVPEVAALFGRIHDRRQDAQRTVAGAGILGPGLLFFSDGRISTTQRRTAQHVSLDRFTGGPMPGLLFEDEALEGGEIRFELSVDPGRLATLRREHPQVLERAKAALDAALDDLARGELQLGAGYGRGYGWMRGQLDGRLWEKEAQQ